MQGGICRITVYATGVGPLSFDNGYAVTASAPSVWIDGFYSNGVAALSGPVAGFPGDVYRITVIIPQPFFTLPSPVGVYLQIAGVNSQNGIALSIATPP